MKIVKLFFLFWIPTIVVLGLSVFSTEQKDVISRNVLPFWLIVQRNMGVLMIIWASGFLNKYISYFIFVFNAIVFSILLAISGNVLLNSMDVMKYGCIEVLAFSIVLSISGKLKIKQLVIAIILIIIAAWLENLVMRGVI